MDSDWTLNGLSEMYVNHLIGDQCLFQKLNINHIFHARLLSNLNIYKVP